LRAQCFLGLLFLSAPRLLFLTALRSSALSLCGFAFCAVGLLALLRRGALGKTVVLFLFAAAKLSGLLALFGFLFLSAPRLLFLTALRSSALSLCGFALCAFGLLALLCRGALGKLVVLFLFAAAKLFCLLAFLSFPLLSATCLPRLAAHQPSSRKTGIRGTRLHDFLWFLVDLQAPATGTDHRTAVNRG
jgi:uncharacterized membrane protein